MRSFSDKIKLKNTQPSLREFFPPSGKKKSETPIENKEIAKSPKTNNIEHIQEVLKPLTTPPRPKGDVLVTRRCVNCEQFFDTPPENSVIRTVMICPQCMLNGFGNPHGSGVARLANEFAKMSSPSRRSVR